MSDRPTADVAAPAVHVHGDASPAEVAAIVAALEVTQPRAAAHDAPAAPPRWRFSGRWWTKPVPIRRDRP